jgi:hypothetical protein
MALFAPGPNAFERDGAAESVHPFLGRLSEQQMDNRAVSFAVGVFVVGIFMIVQGLLFAYYEARLRDRALIKKYVTPGILILALEALGGFCFSIWRFWPVHSL